ncbi:AIPR family protein [uncultured Thiothrix sp.]|uniref:AIPR family protein n=1 Tax=uncultured Thiothrix sp. TaxID=223185 RepID=UPI002616D8AE|nr:AIPR family protein [uncultured Thiothrix sp.]
MELIEFLQQTQQEIREEMASRTAEPGESMPFAELIFTEIVTKHMSEIGMTFEPMICNYTATVSNAKLRLSGYALSDEADQLDLYVSLYDNQDELVNLPDSETTKAAEQCLRFLKMCIEGKLSSKMDSSHEAYEFVFTLEHSYAELNQIRIYVLTDSKVKTKQFKSRAIQDKTIRLEVMDIERLFNHWQEGKPRDELEVNFEDLSGSSLPCIWIKDDLAEYDCALTAIPGEALRFLYEKYGQRILEANVRSFLSQTGKVNKGIRDTLRDQPERFMAYNNGIVIIADDIRLTAANDNTGILGIAWLKGMQIVNGGQTTASLFFTKKNNPSIDLKKIRVPAKIIILKDVDSAQEELLIADISRYANSQNAVKQSDLSANKPYHVQLEKLANSTYCPDGISRWFYERAAGSYKVMLEREGKTPAGIKRLKELIPNSRRITKTDLAKVLCAWEKMPYSVSLGGQKNFIMFMEKLLSHGVDEDIKLPNTNEYKHIIAKIILFNTVQKNVRQKFPAFQANITAYTISVTAMLIGNNIDLDLIWKNQRVSNHLTQKIILWAEEVNKYLQQSANGKMISEWSKKQECWSILSKKTYSVITEKDILEIKS